MTDFKGKARCFPQVKLHDNDFHIYMGRITNTMVWIRACRGPEIYLQTL